jgi:hypothetical protein
MYNFSSMSYDRIPGTYISIREKHCKFILLKKKRKRKRKEMGIVKR